MTIRSAMKAVDVADTLHAPLVSSYSDQDKFLVHQFIIQQLDRLQKKYNLPPSKRYDDQTLEDVAYDLMDQYKHETLEDFVLFFRLVRQGRLKVMKYERFGFDLIQNAFAEYIGEWKAAEREKVLKKQKAEQDKVEGSGAGGYRDLIRRLEAEIKAKQLEKVERKPIQSWTDKQELRLLQQQLPGMSIKELNDWRTQYMNASVYDHSEGRENPFIKLIDEELDRRK